MIDWDEFPFSHWPQEKIEAFETEMADWVEWLTWSRKAEQLLTGQEP